MSLSGGVSHDCYTMAFLSNLLHHPRRLLLRRALFQVHLWLGILLSVYVALIGVSGSILVFEDELRAHSSRDLHADPAHLADPQSVLGVAATRYPGETVTYLMWPSQTTPAYTLYLQTAASGTRTVLADAADGHLLTNRPHLFVDTVHDFHVYLLLGQTGFTLNCLAGIGLLVLAFTGAVLWWPGMRVWFRGFRVHLRGNWKRINYDTHNFIGIVTLAIVSFWGLTAVYFLLPQQTAAAVRFVFPVRGMQEPSLPKVDLPSSSPKPTALSPERVGSVVRQVHALDPHGFLSGVALPADTSGKIIAYVDSRAPGDFSHRNIYTFSAATGDLLTTWHYGQNSTVGDWILWLVYPLHFGTLWGMPVKIAWFLLGLSLPVLSVTGLLMYWNRYLGKRWRALGT